MLYRLLLLLAVPGGSSFVLITPSSRCTADTRAVKHMAPRAGKVCAGLFDGLFGESEAQKAAKDAAWREQQEILQRRRDPKKMEAYMQDVENRRIETTASNAELRELQKGQDGKDALEDWKKLKAEGKVVASEQERDADSSRMGSEGLIAERIDEKLPYIDSGYVDDSQPDIMGGIKKLFGGDDKKA